MQGFEMMIFFAVVFGGDGGSDECDGASFAFAASLQGEGHKQRRGCSCRRARERAGTRLPSLTAINNGSSDAKELCQCNREPSSSKNKNKIEKKKF